MKRISFKYSIGVIGGCGHVGLPFSLIFAKNGHKVLSIDINQERLEMVKSKKMPFIEIGAQALLEQTIDNKKLIISDTLEEITECENIVIVTGTPAEDGKSDLSQVLDIILKLKRVIIAGQCIFLRSTLTPGTTERIRIILENDSNFKVGKDLGLLFAPERIVQGQSIEEIECIPQIIGAYDEYSFKRGEMLFGSIGLNVYRTSPINAELVKLFSNAYRYINFAIANEFMLIAEKLDGDIHEIIKLTNKEYPRANIAKPGLTKGPCLGKDSWILQNENRHNHIKTSLLSSAYELNENIGSFLIESLKKRTSILGKNVAILGTTFKKNIDDERDTPVQELIDLLQAEKLNKLYIHDPYTRKEFKLDEILSKVNIVFIAINHSFYKDVYSKIKSNTWVVDVWNITKQNRIFYQK